MSSPNSFSKYISENRFEYSHSSGGENGVQVVEPSAQFMEPNQKFNLDKLNSKNYICGQYELSSMIKLTIQKLNQILAGCSLDQFKDQEKINLTCSGHLLDSITQSETYNAQIQDQNSNVGSLPIELKSTEGGEDLTHPLGRTTVETSGLLHSLGFICNYAAQFETPSRIECSQDKFEFENSNSTTANFGNSDHMKESKDLVPKSKQHQSLFSVPNVDVMQSCEERAVTLRKSKTRQKIDKLRSWKAQDISILCSNVRGMNSLEKQDQIVKLIRKLNPDIIGLTETKLTKSFKLDKKHTIQSKLARFSGVWVQCRSLQRVKNIKTLFENVTWMTCAYKFVPVHVIICYILPYKTDQVRKLVNRVKHLIMTIFEKWQKSRVIYYNE